MSARFLIAYLVSVGLVAAIVSQALAKPPDLPAKVQIKCEKKSDKLVLKTYQVADLIVPVEGATWPVGAPCPELICPAPTPEEVNRAPGAVPSPAPALAPPPHAPVLASPPVEVIPPPIGYSAVPYPPYFPVPTPLMPAPVFGLAKPSSDMNGFKAGGDFKLLNSVEYQVPIRTNDQPYFVSPQPAQACCPACANAGCTGCCSNGPCQPSACVAAGCAAVPVNTPKKTMEDQLIQLIVNTIHPESWDVNGGRGTIDYFPLGMALTVNQTPDIQEQVAELLAVLRHFQDEQIAIEVRLVSVPQGFGEKVACKVASCAGKCEPGCSDVCVTAKETQSGSVLFGIGANSDAGTSGSICANEASPCRGCCSKECQDSKHTAKLTFLSDEQVKKFMDGIQANPKANVMLAPKVTLFNGQASAVNIVDQQFFVTNVKMSHQGDQAFFIPENRPFSTGFHFWVKPTISEDHRCIQMPFEIEETSLDTAPDHVPLFPVTTFIKPIHEDGSKGDPVPFTMFLQQPTLLTQRVHQEVFVPCGQTVLFKSWTQTPEVREESAFPGLSSLPYIGDMFKNVSYHRETTDIWVMVTPRIILSQDVPDCSPPVAAAEPGTVTDNLQKLQHARALLEQADHCRRTGQVESARHIYERVRELCPGSRYAQMASRRLAGLHAREGDRSHEVLSIVDGQVVKTRASDQEYGNAEAHARYAECYLESPASKNGTDPKVNALMEKYHQACAQGRLSEATQWAVQALALDPACFSKTRDAGGKKLLPPAVAPSAN